MYKWLTVLLGLLVLVFADTASADPELVIIANAKNPVAAISREDAINIYMGRLRQLPTGEPVQPLDLPPYLPEKALFYHLLINKDLAVINAYWAHLIISGQVSPPRTANGPAEVLESVASDTNTIGYIARTAVDKRVKVILELQPESRH